MGCSSEAARAGKQCVINSNNSSNNININNISSNSNNNNNNSVKNSYTPSGETTASGEADEEEPFHKDTNRNDDCEKDDCEEQSADRKRKRRPQLIGSAPVRAQGAVDTSKVAACNLIANANSGNDKTALPTQATKFNQQQQQRHHLAAWAPNKVINNNNNSGYAGSNWRNQAAAKEEEEEEETEEAAIATGEEEAEDLRQALAGSRQQQVAVAHDHNLARCCCSCGYCARSTTNTPTATAAATTTATTTKPTNTSSESNKCGCRQAEAHQCSARRHAAPPPQPPSADQVRCCATAPTIACSDGRSDHMPALLWRARNTLAAQLASVSGSLRDSISFYAAAVDGAHEQLRRQQHCKQQQQRQHTRRTARNLTHTNCGRQQPEMQQPTNCQHQSLQQQRHNNQHHSHSHHHHHHQRRHHHQQQQQQQQQTMQPRPQRNGAASYDGCSVTATTSPASSASAAAFNYIGHNYYHLLRNSISFYAASSVILVLCYLTTTTSAAAANSPEAASLDKHPIQGIDWSKFDESSSDKEILDLLLEKKRYDKRLLPPVNGTLTVNVNVLLLSLASPDESSLKYEVEFLLNQQWNDPRLQYGNKSHYDFLNALHHHDSIWTPDTYFIMHGDFKDPIIPMHFALRIYRNGTITYAMRRHLILSCQGSLHIFPFDDPKCSFSMESISYEEAQIKYVWKNDEDTLRKSPSLTTLNAYLIKNQTTACDQNSWRGNYSCLRVDLIFTRDRAFYFTTVFIPGIILVTSSFITFWLEWNAVPARSMIGNYSCLQVELTFTRDRAYYFTTVFIPGIILVTSSFITFWLEWNAVPARVMIGVTTMLNFFTTSNGFRSTLPVVSNLTAMNVWDGVCMCFIYASLLEFVCVNYMGRKRPQHNAVYRPGENPVTQRLPAVLSRIGVILASPLEIIEREFHAALSSEKAAAGTSSSATTRPVTPTSMSRAESAVPVGSRIRWEEQHGGIISAAMHNLRARSIKRRTNAPTTASSADETPTQMQRIEPIYTEPLFVESTTALPTQTETTVTVEEEPAAASVVTGPVVRHSRSISTNTPPLIVAAQQARTDVKQPQPAEAAPTRDEVDERQQQQQQQKHLRVQSDDGDLPVKPPRKKTSRSTSPAGIYEAMQHGHGGGVDFAPFSAENGEKRRDAGAPNEIVACTTCGGSSSNPCTHSANNGCATETCFVQVRKKEPPHPIRIAKTIDVIARITFPTAYAIFLIFFFVHYKGFS